MNQPYLVPVIRVRAISHGLVAISAQDPKTQEWLAATETNNPAGVIRDSIVFDFSRPSQGWMVEHYL